MVPVVSLLVILGTSLILTRVAAVALEHTGLSRDAARFQARSAFTGVGFTTTESEHVVDHPVRRRIVMWLMLVGNVGIVSAMAAALLSAIDLHSEQGLGVALALLLAGLALLSWIGSSRFVDRQMCRVIEWAIERWTSLDARDYTRLMHLRDEYSVSRVRVEPDDWVAGRTLSQTRLAEEGVLVLGVECPAGAFIGTPPAGVQLRAGDEIVIYGLSRRVAELAVRKTGEAGERAHIAATAEHSERRDAEREQAGR